MSITIDNNSSHIMLTELHQLVSESNKLHSRLLIVELTGLIAIIIAVALAVYDIINTYHMDKKIEKIDQQLETLYTVRVPN